MVKDPRNKFELTPFGMLRSSSFSMRFRYSTKETNATNAGCDMHVVSRVGKRQHAMLDCSN